MEPTTTITILAIAMALALGLAICFGVRMMKLQNKLMNVKNCIEVFSTAEHQLSSHDQPVDLEATLLSSDSQKLSEAADADYDVLIYNRHDGTVEFYKEVDE